MSWGKVKPIVEGFYNDIEFPQLYEGYEAVLHLQSNPDVDDFVEEFHSSLNLSADMNTGAGLQTGGASLSSDQTDSLLTNTPSAWSSSGGGLLPPLQPGSSANNLLIPPPKQDRRRSRDKKRELQKRRVEKQRRIEGGASSDDQSEVPMAPQWSLLSSSERDDRLSGRLNSSSRSGSFGNIAELISRTSTGGSVGRPRKGAGAGGTGQVGKREKHQKYRLRQEREAFVDEDLLPEKQSSPEGSVPLSPLEPAVRLPWRERTERGRARNLGLDAPSPLSSNLSSSLDSELKSDASMSDAADHDVLSADQQEWLQEKFVSAYSSTGINPRGGFPSSRSRGASGAGSASAQRGEMDGAARSVTVEQDSEEDEPLQRAGASCVDFSLEKDGATSGVVESVPVEEVLSSDQRSLIHHAEAASPDKKRQRTDDEPPSVGEGAGETNADARTDEGIESVGGKSTPGDGATRRGKYGRPGKGGDGKSAGVLLSSISPEDHEPASHQPRPRSRAKAAADEHLCAAREPSPPEQYLEEKTASAMSAASVTSASWSRTASAPYACPVCGIRAGKWPTMMAHLTKKLHFFRAAHPPPARVREAISACMSASLDLRPGGVVSAKEKIRAPSPPPSPSSARRGRKDKDEDRPSPSGKRRRDRQLSEQNPEQGADSNLSTNQQNSLDAGPPRRPPAPDVGQSSVVVATRPRARERPARRTGTQPHQDQPQRGRGGEQASSSYAR